MEVEESYSPEKYEEEKELKCETGSSMNESHKDKNSNDNKLENNKVERDEAKLAKWIRSGSYPVLTPKYPFCFPYLKTNVSDIIECDESQKFNKILKWKVTLSKNEKHIFSEYNIYLSIYNYM